ncbi:hypothetical protein [Campylobacter sp. IFREMER_LSEM_CL1085]|uniref:hypothetical protein n=1 Tax=Campylobacter sp. IFREMER_LSEM_CL1085 TaxID=2911612 RepID=UPI0021E6839A|nr:hypothetical protein [Campylobacter sp. IFREMER_LSEM_CL1085]MCV3425587.1 hypothetical protein [Campylobacter sp. IFREMER_LSEM_CL1085]
MAKKRKITLPKIEAINISPDTSCLHPILEDNTLLCIHGGKVNLKAKNAKRIKSDNVPIMLNNEIQGASISGCVNPPMLGGPCTKVALVFAHTYSNHKVNHKHSVLQMGLIGVSNKGYPILAIPKKNKIKFALAKIQANPLAKIKWDKIRWEGIGGKLKAAQRRKQVNKQQVFLKEVQAQQKEAKKVLANMEKKIQKLNGIDKLSNKQKGNYGEAKMHLHYLNQGYKRISLNKVQGLDDKIHQGIDGIYYNPNKNPKYIIAEAKFGTSKLNRNQKTKQMSNSWILEEDKNRLGVADEEHREKIKELLEKNSNEIRKDLFHVDEGGKETIHYLDKDANKIKKPKG